MHVYCNRKSMNDFYTRHLPFTFSPKKKRNHHVKILQELTLVFFFKFLFFQFNLEKIDNFLLQLLMFSYFFIICI